MQLHCISLDSAEMKQFFHEMTFRTIYLLFGVIPRRAAWYRISRSVQHIQIDEPLNAIAYWLTPFVGTVFFLICSLHWNFMESIEIVNLNFRFWIILIFYFFVSKFVTLPFVWNKCATQLDARIMYYVCMFSRFELFKFQLSEASHVIFSGTWIMLNEY